MKSATEMLAQLATTQAEKINDARARNRANFPNAAAFMDQFARFNPRLVYASEGGKTIGTQYKSKPLTDRQRECLEGK